MAFRGAVVGQTGGRPARTSLVNSPPLSVPPEVTTVADDEVVIFDGSDIRRYTELVPGTELNLDGVVVRTLDRPAGELLCRFATVNDVHFGETLCGLLEEFDVGPVLEVEPGERPYPLTMNEAAVTEIAAIDPAAVIAKGDLTSNGARSEYQAFLDCYGSAFGDRLVHVRGNHDGAHGGDFAAWPHQRVDLPGVRLAVLDTTRPGHSNGQLTAEQIDWLDTEAAQAEHENACLVVLGHHHPWNPASLTRDEQYFGIDPSASEALVEVIARRPAVVAYLCGHTHRNRVRRFDATGEVPFVEVACTKDFPGAWAEYRVFEGGILQVQHRISEPTALSWTERTRALFGGMYPGYAFGDLTDRCFAFGRT